jgi:hypothetical protein
MNVPHNLRQLKGDILVASVTPYRYTISPADELAQGEISEDQLVSYLDQHIRTQILRDKVKLMNNNSIVPHIVDFGPGPYHMPRAMMKMGLKFTYWDLPLNQSARDKARPLLANVLSPDGAKTRPTIFLGLEVIEHLHNEEDLAIEALKNCGRWPEMVMLSTPFCTYRVIPEEEDWRKWQLEHLRAYTPQEFQASAQRIFPPYVWNLCVNDPTDAEPMSLIGTRIDLVEAAKHTEKI